jgi:TonB-dependent starch-binding outer membrane protein SusC
MKHKLLLFKGGFLILLLMCSLSITYAQVRQVSGKVTSADDGDGLPGVNVSVKGTTTGTVTDLDGNFKISVPDNNAVLVFSFVGFSAEEVAVGNRSTINLKMKSDVKALSEVVVIGYGQVDKKDATGNVIALGEKEFNKGVINSPEQLLQGRAAGVQITPSSGEPGAALNIRILGTSSVRAGNNPLFVVDGVPLDGGNTTAGGTDYGAGSAQPRNPLNFLNPDDIESISVLMDASATAIYGSRGANGVVLITTKKGKAGTSGLTFSTSASIGTRAKKLDLLSPDEYVDYAVRAGANRDVVNFGSKTDWQDEIFRSAFTQNYSLGYGGGNDKTNYRMSLGYMNQEGIIKNTALERITGRVNATHKLIDDKLVLDLQLTASQLNDQYAPLGENAGFQGNLIGAAIQANPTRPIRNTNGTFSQPDDFRNPAAMLAYIDDRANTLRMLSNVGLTWNITSDLSYRVNFGYDNSAGVRRTSIDKKLNMQDNGVGGANSGRGRGFINNTYQKNQIIEHVLNYKKDLGSSKFDVVAGYSYQQFESRGHNLRSEFFTLDDVPPVDNMGGVNNNTQRAFLGGSYRGRDEIQSFFGRANYTINDKYLFTATVRADGSSKFGENNKYGVFPSAAAAWRISKENFFPSGGAVDDLKLRVNYGITGNQEFPRNAALTVLRADNRGGTFTSNSYNPDLRWEETTQFGIGIDFSIYKSRLTGKVDYFYKDTKNMLILVDYPAPAFSITRWENLSGSVINNGVLASLDFLAVSNNDFSWNILGNATYLHNEVKDMGVLLNTGAINGQGLSGAYAQRITDGIPLYSFFMREFEGFTENGLGIYADNERLKYMGSPFPTWSFGITNNFTYGNWDASIFFNGVTGNYVYNNTANAIFLKGNLRNGRNVSREVADSNENPNNFGEASSRFLERGDFLRLQNLSLGYNFNISNNKYIKSLRASFTGQNLMLFTGYSGYDPEVNTNKAINGVPSLGIDYLSFPLPRMYTVGINVGF